jgi:hypothetical protein
MKLDKILFFILENEIEFFNSGFVVGRRGDLK